MSASLTVTPGADGAAVLRFTPFDPTDRDTWRLVRLLRELPGRRYSAGAWIVPESPELRELLAAESIAAAATVDLAAMVAELTAAGYTVLAPGAATPPPPAAAAATPSTDAAPRRSGRVARSTAEPVSDMPGGAYPVPAPKTGKTDHAAVCAAHYRLPGGPIGTGKRALWADPVLCVRRPDPLDPDLTADWTDPAVLLATVAAIRASAAARAAMPRPEYVPAPRVPLPEHMRAPVDLAELAPVRMRLTGGRLEHGRFTAGDNATAVSVPAMYAAAGR